jgi:hypothetical protein
MFNDVGFYTKRRGFGGAGGVTPAPSRNLVITPTLTNNAERVTWTITSNMPNVVLDFNFIGANSTTFVESTTSGNVTLNSNGSATIVRNLDKFNDYANTSNLAVNIDFFAPGSAVFLANATNNVVVGPANTFTATGGTITNFTGGVDNLQGEYTLHSFESSGLYNLTVTNVGEFPSNSVIDVVAIGGGGAGGSAWWTNSPANLTPAEIAGKLMGSYEGYAGGGGAGGNVNISNITASGFAAANYTVGVGFGGTPAPVGPSGVATAGGVTWFAGTANIVASGGGAGETGESLGAGGSDGGANSPYLKGNEASRTYSSFDNTRTWIERTGGGGAGALANGGNATISTGVNGPSANDGYGGSGGSGRSFTITGNVITAGGGGGGGTINNTNNPSPGGLGGGGNGAEPGTNATTGGNGGGGGGGGGGEFTIAGSSKVAINYYTNRATGTDVYDVQQGSYGGSGKLYIRYLSKYRRLSIQS